MLGYIHSSFDLRVVLTQGPQVCPRSIGHQEAELLYPFEELSHHELVTQDTNVSDMDGGANWNIGAYQSC